MTRYELTTPSVRDTLIRFAVVPWSAANWPVRDTVFLLFFRHYRHSGVHAIQDENMNIIMFAPDNDCPYIAR